MYEMCSEERQKYTKKSYNNNFYYTQSIDWHTRGGEGENACKINMQNAAHVIRWKMQDEETVKSRQLLDLRELYV